MIAFILSNLMDSDLNILHAFSRNPQETSASTYSATAYYYFLFLGFRFSSMPRKYHMDMGSGGSMASSSDA